MDANEMSAAAGALPRAFTIRQEILIDAPPERVWYSLTQDMFNWWSHSYMELPHDIRMDARAGGQFVELFDDQGNGALHSTVTFCKPPHTLKLIGTMGMRHPVINQSVFDLEDVDGKTRLAVTMESFGIVEPHVEAGYRDGWGQLLGHLKALVEQGVSVRRPESD